MANIFNKSVNKVPLQVIIGLILVGSFVGLASMYYFTPAYARVGYQPDQPVNFQHTIHVEQLGMDCRYCHSYVDQSPHANIPDAATCMNCHSMVQADSPSIAPIKESYESGEPIKWVRIHQAPDYVYFNHSAHVNRGISCVECHGQINEMDTVQHAKSLSMSFCLDCHRNPEEYIRPLDKVTDLNWAPESREAQIKQGTEFVHDWKVNPPQSCSGCHR